MAPISRHHPNPMAIPREAVAFYTALNTCGRATTPIHPVHVRNCGMLPAIKAWTKVHYPKKLDGIVEGVLGCTRFGLYDGIRVVQDIVLSHPERLGKGATLQSADYIKPACLLAAAPLMFWTRRNAIIESTDALETLLAHSDLGEELPAGVIRPPFPACYIKLGEIFRDSIPSSPMIDGDHKQIQGIYVFESMIDTNVRALGIAPVIEVDNRTRVVMGSTELHIHDEDMPVNDIIDKICGETEAAHAPHLRALINICAKVFLYMSVAQSQQLMDTSYSVAEKQLKNYGQKKLAKRNRQIAHLYDRILLGPQTLPTHDGSEHGEVSPHWRRGHFRLQPYGPKAALRKVLFIMPVLIRADKLAE